MAIKKTIAIIGATGNEGSSIARTLVKSDYRLLLISTAPDELQKLVNELASFLPGSDIEGMECVFDASWEADIVIMALPPGAQNEIAGKIREVTTGKTVISIATSPENDYNGLLPAADTGSGNSLQQLLPHSKVIKVCYTGNAGDLSATLLSFLN